MPAGGPHNSNSLSDTETLASIRDVVRDGSPDAFLQRRLGEFDRNRRFWRQFKVILFALSAVALALLLGVWAL